MCKEKLDVYTRRWPLVNNVSGGRRVHDSSQGSSRLRRSLVVSNFVTKYRNSRIEDRAWRKFGSFVTWEGGVGLFRSSFEVSGFLEHIETFFESMYYIYFWEVFRIRSLKEFLTSTILYILNILLDNLQWVSFPEPEKVAYINYNIINFKHREKC